MHFLDCGSMVTYVCILIRGRKKTSFPISVCNFAKDRNCVEMELSLPGALCELQRGKFLPDPYTSKIASNKQQASTQE